MKGGTLQINWHDTKPVLTLDFHPLSGILATAGADYDIKVFLLLLIIIIIIIIIIIFNMYVYIFWSMYVYVFIKLNNSQSLFGQSVSRIWNIKLETKLYIVVLLGFLWLIKSVILLFIYFLICEVEFCSCG